MKICINLEIEASNCRLVFINVCLFVCLFNLMYVNLQLKNLNRRFVFMYVFNLSMYIMIYFFLLIHIIKFI